VDGVASPYTGLWLIAIGWGGGGGTSLGSVTWSCGDDACREEEASQGVIIGWWLCPLLVPVHEIS
jgi:hypothetical protein